MLEKTMTLEEQLSLTKEQLQDLIDYRNTKILYLLGMIGIITRIFILFSWLVTMRIVDKEFFLEAVSLGSIALFFFISMQFLLFPHSSLMFLRTLRTIRDFKKAIRNTEQYLNQNPKINNIDGELRYAAP